MLNFLGYLYVFFIIFLVNNIIRCILKIVGKYFIKIIKICGVIFVK